MRKFLTLLWLLFPVAVVYYHFNEGQAQLAREKARARLVLIRGMERTPAPDWPAVVEEYDLLMAELPPSERPSVRHQVRLAQAIEAGVEARTELEQGTKLTPARKRE
ncbi:MAG: hypothetical protein ACO3ND_07030, partial [Opitutales bacterium]